MESRPEHRRTLFFLHSNPQDRPLSPRQDEVVDDLRRAVPAAHDVHNVEVPVWIVGSKSAGRVIAFPFCGKGQIPRANHLHIRWNILSADDMRAQKFDRKLICFFSKRLVLVLGIKKFRIIAPDLLQVFFLAIFVFVNTKAFRKKNATGPKQFSRVRIWTDRRPYGYLPSLENSIAPFIDNRPIEAGIVIERPNQVGVSSRIQQRLGMAPPSGSVIIQFLRAGIYFVDDIIPLANIKVGTGFDAFDGGN